jgi:hypothetical protein
MPPRRFGELFLFISVWAIRMTLCFVCSQACVVPIESFLSGPAWTPSGAGFKLGRKPLAIYRASTSIDFLSSDTSGFDRTYLPTGTFHAVNGEERSERGKYVGGGYVYFNSRIWAIRMTSCFICY